VGQCGNEAAARADYEIGARLHGNQLGGEFRIAYGFRRPRGWLDGESCITGSKKKKWWRHV